MNRFSERLGLLHLLSPSLLAIGSSLGLVSMELMPTARGESVRTLAPASPAQNLERSPVPQRSSERPEALTGRKPNSSIKALADRWSERAEAASSVSARRVEVPEQTVHRPALSRTTLVVDIDETLCITDYNSVLWGIGRDDSVPLPGAVAAMSRLAREYNIVYLTARPKSCENRTRRWLVSRGFPDGPLVTSPTVGDFLGQTGFKKSMLAKLQQQYGRMLIGIGDKPTDAEAYRHNGMLPVIVNPWRDRRYQDREIVIQDWSGILAFFERNRDVLTDSRRLADGLQRGHLPLQIRG
jgi:hypothetical protein